VAKLSVKSFKIIFKRVKFKKILTNPLFNVLGLVLVLFLVNYLLYLLLFLNRVYPRVYLANISVGGKTAQEAKTILENRVKTPQNITLTSQGKTHDIELDKIDFQKMPETLLRGRSSCSQSAGK